MSTPQLYDSVSLSSLSLNLLLLGLELSFPFPFLLYWAVSVHPSSFRGRGAFSGIWSWSRTFSTLPMNFSHLDAHHITCSLPFPGFLHETVKLPVFSKLYPSYLVFFLLLFSYSVVSDSLWPHGLQHSRLPCPSLSPGVCSSLCPLSQWCLRPGNICWMSEDVNLPQEKLESISKKYGLPWWICG